MGVVQPTVTEVDVVCDGPECSVTSTATDPANPVPSGWLVVWGPPQKLGQFYFHLGACYDNWKAELDATIQAQADEVAATLAAEAEATNGE